MSNCFDNTKEINVSAAFLLPCPVMAAAMLHFHGTTALVLRQYSLKMCRSFETKFFSLSWL